LSFNDVRDDMEPLVSELPFSERIT